MDFPQNSFSLGSDVRLCIFLIVSVCVGLLALVWAFYYMHRHRIRMSVFIAILLFGDLIEVILDLYTVAQLIQKLYWSPNMLVQLWSGLHLCGFILHQLVALEGLKYQLCEISIASCPCYIIISILLLAFSVLNAFIFNSWIHGSMDQFVNTYISFFSLGTGLAPLSLLAAFFKITCKASSTPVSKNTRSVFAVAIFTFVMLYLPFMLFICVNLITGGVHISWCVMTVCLMSLRVISDPILCVLVCRGKLRAVQTPQTHTEPSAAEMSV